MSPNEAKAVRIAGLSLVISLAMLVVTLFGYASSIASFFDLPTPGQAAARDRATHDVMEALASRDPERLARTLDASTAPDSAARTFLRMSYWTYIAAGTDEPLSLLGARERWTICASGGALPCTSYGEFVFDDEDRVSNFQRAETWISRQIVEPLGGDSKSDLAIEPVLGQVRADRESSSFVLRVRSHRENPATLSRCLKVDSDTGETTHGTIALQQPAEISSWQDRYVLCAFDLADRPATHWVGLVASHDDTETTLWARYEDMS